MPPADALDLVHRVASNARKLERLLGDLLDLDRLQRGIVSPQRRSTDIGALIARVLAEVENPDGRPIDVEAGPLTATVDGPKVERIVENLVANALRHTPPDARVLVWARADGRRHRDRRRRRGAGGARRGARIDLRAVRAASGADERPLARASASACRSCDGSPSCTTAARGSRSARAAAPRSACSCPTADRAAALACPPMDLADRGRHRRRRHRRARRRRMGGGGRRPDRRRSAAAPTPAPPSARTIDGTRG